MFAISWACLPLTVQSQQNHKGCPVLSDRPPVLSGTKQQWIHATEKPFRHVIDSSFVLLDAVCMLCGDVEAGGGRGGS